MPDRSGDQAKKEGYLQGNYRYFHLKDTEGSEHSFHFHEFAKVVLFRSGKVEYIIEQVSYNLLPGSILLVPHHAIHKAVIDPSVPYDRVVIYLDRRYLERSMMSTGRLECFDRADVRGNCLLLPDAVRRHEIERTLEEYEEALTDQEPGADTIRDAVMTKLLIRIERVSRLNEETEGSKGDGRQSGISRHGTDPGLAELLTYINESLREDLTVDALAARMCLSRYHFMRHGNDGTYLRAAETASRCSPADTQRRAGRAGGGGQRVRRLFLLQPRLSGNVRHPSVRTEIIRGGLCHMLQFIHLFPAGVRYNKSQVLLRARESLCCRS